MKARGLSRNGGNRLRSKEKALGKFRLDSTRQALNQKAKQRRLNLETSQRFYWLCDLSK